MSENVSMAYFFEVWVASQRYHNSSPLTYAFSEEIAINSLVVVPLQDKSVIAVVSKETKRPSFPTKDILRLIELPPLPDYVPELLEWMLHFYPSPSGMITQQFIPKNLISSKIPVLSSEKINRKLPDLPPLTAEQKKAVEKINQSGGTFLLHGQTGSGKTRVYQEIIKHTLAQGRSAIVLTPEISLTTQLVNNLQRNIEANVLVVHSQLTDTQRRDVWLQVHTAREPLVVVGARSALFVPMQKLGVIVIDESHEPSYKQEQTPHYQTQRVASKLAQLTGSKLVFGSATPTLAEYYWAEQKNIPILELNELPMHPAKSSIKIVDMKNRDNFSRSNYLSDALVDAISSTLTRKEQVLLFLNRRGSARLVLCQNCGWQAFCPNCDVPLIYHNDKHILMCHLCNYSGHAFSECPNCKGTNIIFRGIGTKSLLDEVKRLFPAALVQRFDSDNKKSERFEFHYDQILRGDVDILVGTQSLAKGLDLPKLRLVGVVFADLGLSSPDYTSTERLFQLISQVVGRIGRGHTEGEAVIQTYLPDDKILNAALRRDWKTFYEQELKERQQFTYPPYCHLLKLGCRRASISSVERASDTLLQKLKNSKLKVSVLGPAPAFHEKIGGKYNWQIVVKSKDRRELLQVISLLPSGWTYDIDPINLL